VRILKCVAITVVVLGLIYAVATVVSLAKLRRVYADLEKAGRPMKPADVIPPAVPDAQNAALLYESAILLLKAQPAAEENLLKYLGGLSGTFLTESLDADERAELEQLLGQDAVRQALVVIKQGTGRPSCRFDHNYEAGFGMLMPYLPGARDLIRILGATACLEAQAGRSEAAWDLVQTQLRFADALRKEPILISQLVRFASIRISCETIQKISEIAPPNEEQWRSIDRLLQDYEDNTPLILALDGERLLGGEWAFNLLKNGPIENLGVLSSEESGFGNVLLALYSAFKPLSLADHAAYLRIMGEHARSALKPYAPGEQSDLDAQASRLHIVTSMIVPALGRIKEVYCEMVAEMRVTRAGLALLQYKKAHDSFPQTLEELGLKDISDPFSGGPLLYRPGPNGFVLYSVGPDQKDNGGAPKQKKQKADWDIVWQFGQ
jgi:hypothetical protein